MSHTSLEEHLNLVEQQFSEVSSILLDGDPAELQQACTDLQRRVVEFLQLGNTMGLDTAEMAALASRARTVAAGLPLLREGLHRKAALVDRALQLVVPTTEPTSTYGGQAVPYTRARRSSGVFGGAAA